MVHDSYAKVFLKGGKKFISDSKREKITFWTTYFLEQCKESILKEQLTFMHRKMNILLKADPKNG